jgi:peptidoglycan/LPS O-acetylase OafA/YrhL
MPEKYGVNNKTKTEILHYDYLDALRGVAILMVLSVHFTMFLNLFDGKRFAFGAYGVQLFYILSALTLFLSSSQRFVSEKKPVLNFYIRRFFRIAPLFYAAIVIYCLLWQFAKIEYRLPAGQILLDNIVAHFLFIFGFSKYWINSIIGVEWSIFCEVCFYLSLPILFKYIKDKKSAITLAVLSALIAFVSSRLFYSSEKLLHEWSSFFILQNYFYFALGIVLYFFVKEKKQYSQKLLRLGWLVLFCLTGIMLIIDRNFYTTILFSLFLALFIFLMQYGDNISNIFNNKFTRFLGKISYSIYLLHFLILNIIAKLIINPNLKFFNQNPVFKILAILSSFIIVLVVSTIFYNIIEKPGIKIGKILISRIES